jgi:hypothetical protein
VIEKSLAGPIGIFVKFSTLQEYGVDKVFFLENGNADVSQRNVVFMARGESAKHVQSIAGVYLLFDTFSYLRVLVSSIQRARKADSVEECPIST